MDKSHKSNWTEEEEECTLINEIESAGEILRDSGNSADKNKRRKQIWRDIAGKLNSVHSYGRAVEYTQSPKSTSDGQEDSGEFLKAADLLSLQQ